MLVIYVILIDITADDHWQALDFCIIFSDLHTIMGVYMFYIYIFFCIFD